MDFRFTAEQENLRGELRTFLRDELPSDWKVENDREAMSDDEFSYSQHFARRLGERGWLTMAWPREFGGRSASQIEQLIFAEEMAYAGAPLGFGFGTQLVGPTLMVWGNDDQKSRFLPPIARSEVFWCQGFSEPGAGSDLAGLQTRAVRQGDDYIINGQKIWTSEGQYADWMILLARTDTEAPKHRGISYFLLDMKTPGITLQPLINLMGTHAFNQVFFDNVRVPAANLVGEENRGWYVATTTLDFERTGIARVIWALRQFEELAGLIREAAAVGAAWARRPSLKHKLAELRIEFEIARMLCYRVAWIQVSGAIPNYESSMAKVFGSELNQRFGATAMNILGLAGQLEPGSRWAPLQGRLERTYMAGLSYTIAGGTSEIQRNIIAQRGLSLPRG
ncbi:MAG: acyl-CoA dehydrogenase family protein [Chloroflexi bacterium]|nr:acyl-CoA dehydrogenase family protein [Chloroflexota bacterium]